MPLRAGGRVLPPPRGSPLCTERSLAFLASVAIGTLVGGPLGDKIGRKAVIWGSIVGVLPFALMLPYADLFWTGILIAIVGLVLASATSAIIVYALDLLPGRIGMVS